MAYKAKEEIINLIKTSIIDYSNKENLKIRAIVIGKLLEKYKLFNFRAKLNNLKYTYSQRGNNYTILTKIISNLMNKFKIEDITFEVFLNELNNWFSEIKEKEMIQFKIIFPINLDFREAMPIRFITHKEDIGVKLVSAHDFKAKYYGDIFTYKNHELNTLSDKRQINLIDEMIETNHSYFVLEIYGRNTTYAIEQGAKVVNINSGIFSFIKYAYYRFISFGGDIFRKRIGKIDTPIVFVFKRDNSTLKLVNVLYSSYQAPRRVERVDRSEIELFLSKIDEINHIQNKNLQSMGINVFDMYYDAIRKDQLSNAFLTFWNIMEYLLLNSPELKESVFIKRIKAMYREDLDTLKEQKIIVDLLYSKRNLLVHESIDTIDEYDRDFIKIDVEFMIEYFLLIAKEVENIDALNFFYDHITRPLKILDNELKVLNYIKKTKIDNSSGVKQLELERNNH